MDKLKTISEWMKDLDVEITQLVECSGLDKKVIEAIVAGRYTTSPSHRQRLSNALGVPPDMIRWCQTVEVEHMYGHGPQFGRSP
jgi:plasmid maintenance system antidote protein VapI